jgi:hypothetical protein
MSKKPETVLTTIRVERELWAKVKVQAFSEHLSATELVIKSMEAYLKAKGAR